MNKKKRIIIIVMTVFIVIAAVGAIVLAIDNAKEPQAFVSSFVYNSDYDAQSYIFFEPEQDADIFDDPEYLKYVPYIYYTRDGVTKCITDENYAAYGDAVQLFGKYFDALKAGDTDAFNALHSERYFANNRRCEDIAPQKLYNINIEYIFEKDMVDPDYGEVTKYLFKTSYMILKNDGTFRSDIGSEAARPLYLEVVDDGNSIFVDACGDKYNLPE